MTPNLPHPPEHATGGKCEPVTTDTLARVNVRFKGNRNRTRNATDQNASSTSRFKPNARVLRVPSAGTRFIPIASATLRTTVTKTARGRSETGVWG